MGAEGVPAPGDLTSNTTSWHGRVHTRDFRIEEAEMGKSWGFDDQPALGSWKTLKTSNRAGHLLSVRFRSIGTHA